MSPPIPCLPLRACFALLLCSSILASPISAEAGPVPPTVGFATYLGGFDSDSVRDVALDPAGNAYIVGGTASADFPATPGAYDTALDASGTHVHDVFVAKLSPHGALVWATYLGGPEYDRAYAVEVDAAGFVYVGGRAGAGFPTTPGALQTVFAGDVTASGGVYGDQDAFVTKLSPDGSSLVWSTYFGTDDRSALRDIDVDAAGNVYVVIGGVMRDYPHVTPGAFLTTLPGNIDGVVAKIAADGSRVVWGSYIGGSAKDFSTPSIRVDRRGRPIVVAVTQSVDYPVTPGAYDTSYNGGGDLAVTKFAADGASLVFSTFVGGSQLEFSETHGLEVTANGAPVIAATTLSDDFPVTPGAFQTAYGGTGSQGTGRSTNYPGDGIVFRLSASGDSLQAATYLGGRNGEGIEGVAMIPDGRVRVSGATYSPDFPVTVGALRSTLRGPNDLFAAILSADLSTLEYSTLIGGDGIDQGRSVARARVGRFLIGGATNSTDFATSGAAQSTLQGPNGGDGAVVMLVPEPDARAVPLACLLGLAALAGCRRSATPDGRPGRVIDDVSAGVTLRTS